MCDADDLHEQTAIARVSSMLEAALYHDAPIYRLSNVCGQNRSQAREAPARNAGQA